MRYIIFSFNLAILFGCIYPIFSLTASSIFCYDCNSAFDPRCGEEFDPFSLGVINCSLKDPPEHIEPTEPTFCRVIKMDIYGKVRVVRSCGYLQEAPSNHTCRRQTGVGELFVTYCHCDTDLCNGVSSLHYEMALLPIVAALTTCYFMIIN
ncbi:UPAR/Ly6 domain-containing protein crok-like [Epargyreus clarus]|uniref:UPAR/Ly6 domain-containing protein crok-like n=1 Tax=Epargyreus clarus TaxID=520877 RepID=UPI003C2CA920